MGERSLGENLRANRGGVMIVAAALLALGLLNATEAYAAPVTQKHAETHPRWSESAGYEYAAPVSRNATLWPNGTVLPMGEPAYFRTVSPLLYVNFTWRAEDLQPETGVVDAQMALSIRADAGNGRSYWQARHVLDVAQSRAPLDGVTLHGVVDLDNETAEVAALLQTLPVDGKINWTIETSVHYAINRTGVEEGSSSFALPIRIADPRIVLPGPADLTWLSPHADTVTLASTHVAGIAGALDSLPALGMTALGLALLVAIAWAEATDPTRGVAPGLEAFAAEKSRHAQWITELTRPLDTRSLPAVVDVASLDDLVQLANDARTRVVLDGRARVFYALSPSATYRYAKHAAHGLSPVRPSAPVGTRP